MNDKVWVYAGIGSRKTPAPIRAFMHRLAFRLALQGATLSSGGAEGADRAFEVGARSAGGRVKIWIPWQGFQGYTDEYLPTNRHWEIAKTLHPVWDKLSQGVKALHSRNVGQILGEDTNTPVNCVICWTPDGCESDSTRTSKTGGTGTAISLASHWQIPVFNLANENSKSRLYKFVKETLIGN